MEEILHLARQLGEAIARHPHFRALRQAEEAVRNDSQARQLIEQFDRQQEKIAQLTRQQKPIEPEDKRTLARLQQEIMGNELLKKLQQAQVDFRHLMDQVDQAIRQALEPDRGRAD